MVFSTIFNCKLNKFECTINLVNQLKSYVIMVGTLKNSKQNGEIKRGCESICVLPKDTLEVKNCNEGFNYNHTKRVTPISEKSLIHIYLYSRHSLYVYC